MLTILLVIQIFIAIAMIVTILLQKSSAAGGGVAGLSGGGGGDSLLSGRASANLLTRTTAILATAFLANSLAMATITARSNRDSSINPNALNVQVESGVQQSDDVIPTENKAVPAVPAAE